MQKARSPLSYILRTCLVVGVIVLTIAVAFFGEIQGEKVINFARTGFTHIKNFEYAEGIKQLELAEKHKNCFFKLYIYISTLDSELLKVLSTEHLKDLIIISKINIFANMLGKGDIKSINKNHFLTSLERDFTQLKHNRELYVETFDYLKRITPMVKDCKNKHYRKAYEAIVPFVQNDQARIKSGKKKEALAMKPLCYIFYELAKIKMEDKADFNFFTKKILFYANLKKDDPFFQLIAARTSKLRF